MKLLHGDATIEMATITTESVDSIITDPPYGVSFESHYDDSPEYVFGNVGKWYSEWYRILKEGRHMFVFVPTKEIHQWINGALEAGFNFKNIITTKAHYIGGTFKPKNGFSNESQHILHLTKGSGAKFEEYDFVKTSDSWYNDKRNTNPKRYSYEYPNYIDKSLAFANTKSVKNRDRHPNEKNVELLKFLIGISTKEGEVVLDSFMGSGSTGIAAKALNRDFIGIEMDNHYFESTKTKLNNNKTELTERLTRNQKLLDFYKGRP